MSFGEAVRSVYKNYATFGGRAPRSEYWWFQLFFFLAIPTYLVWAILVTLFCFLPTGIVAIVFASQVSSKLQAGDVPGATDASNKAKMWTIISAVAGVLLAVILIAASAGNTPTFTP